MPAGSRLQAAKIARSMAIQLDRANIDNARREIEDKQREIERLESLLKIAREKVQKLEGEKEILRLQLESASHIKQQLTASRPLALPGLPAPASTLNYKARPASTPKQIAARYGVHISTVIRRLQKGKLAGEQLPGSNRWIVYTDQPISFDKERKS